MGFFKKFLTRSKSNPHNTQSRTPSTLYNQNPLTFISTFFSDDFDVNSPEATVVSNTVYSVVMKITQSICNLPISSDNQYLQDLINKKPNPLMNGRELEASVLLNMLVFGDAFCLLTTDNKTGLISRIDLLPNPDISIEITNKGKTYYYAPTDQTFTENQVLRFSLPSIDGINSISPLVPLKNKLRLSMASQKSLHEYFKNGLFSKTIIDVKDNVNDDEKQKIKDQFKQNLGSDNFGGSIIQDDDYINSIKPYSTSNGNNSGFIKDTKTLNDQINRAVCADYGIPASIGIGLVNSHANTSDEMNRYHSSLQCYINILTAELNSKLSGNWSIGNFVNVNTASDVASLAKSNAITPTQAQQLLGLTSDNNNSNNNNKVNSSNSKGSNNND